MIMINKSLDLEKHHGALVSGEQRKHENTEKSLTSMNKFFRHVNFWNAFLLLCLASISTPAKSNQTQSISDSIYGFWTLENNRNSLQIAIKSNNGFAKIFLLGGDWSEISSQWSETSSQPIFPYRGKADAITKSFKITTSSVTIPFFGLKEISRPDKGDTEIIEEIYNLRAAFRQGTLEIQLPNGKLLSLRRMTFTDTIFEYVSIIFSTFIAIVLLMVAIITYARFGVSRVVKMLTAKRDRRYTKQFGRLRGGGSYGGIIISIMFGFIIIFAIHACILGFSGIGGFLSHINFWFF